MTRTSLPKNDEPRSITGYDLEGYSRRQEAKGRGQKGKVDYIWF